MTYGERDPGVVGVAAPIFSRPGHVIAGLTVVMPEHRLDASQLDATVELVRTSAQEIGATLSEIDS